MMISYWLLGTNKGLNINRAKKFKFKFKKTEASETLRLKLKTFRLVFIDFFDLRQLKN